VAIDGTVIGTITTDATGSGRLVLSSRPKGPNQAPLPANFPASLAAGAKVTIGDNTAGDNLLSGTLAVPTPGRGEHRGDDGDHEEDENEINLAANLTGTTAATATAVFHSETEDGTTKSLFAVKVKGGHTGDVLAVAVDGVTVGSITIDANGNGSLAFSTSAKSTAVPFPANFPTTIGANSTITVGTILSGMLAAKVD